MHRRFAEIRRKMHRRITGENLIESLYFDWMAEPYQRASLAVDFKCMQVVEHELELRAHNAGALTNQQLLALVDWLESALERSSREDFASFAPQRIQVNVGRWLDVAPTAEPSPPAALFAFADRSTFTQADRWFGDFDLLACLGFRLYPVGRNRPLTARDVIALRTHADAIGIALLDAPLATDESNRPSALAAADARIQPVSLRELVAAPERADVVPAIIDPPGGESWAAFLARRALYRGLTGRSYTIAVGDPVPYGVTGMRPERARAAMWVAAIDGQRVGILEGWRDVRDGTPTRYGSRLLEPGYLEAVAHTALDILRLDDVVRRFANPPRQDVVIEATGLDPRDDNALSREVVELADALLTNQIAFNLRIRENEGRVAEADGRRRSESHSRSLDNRGGHGESDQPIAGVPDRYGQVHVLHESDGRRAAGVFVRSAADGGGVAVVNLLGIERDLTIAKTRGAAPRRYVDRLSGAMSANRVHLAPYQVRLLFPADEGPSQ